MSVGILFLVLFTFTLISFKVKVNKTKNRIPTDVSDETDESEGK
jgi:hypothetical protein